MHILILQSNKHPDMKSLILLMAAMSVAAATTAQDSLQRLAARTEVWKPEPRVVKPGIAPHLPPDDALVLFDGKHLDAWRAEWDSTQPAGWTVANGILTVNKDKGGIVTRKRFTDYQLHLEYLIPEDISGSGQDRGNSGVFLAQTGSGDEGYEIQILDNYNNKTYANGQAGSVYKQHIPLVNACRKPGEWQSYDIIWQAPRFDRAGTLVSPAYVTVLHNGVLIQNHVELLGQTRWAGSPFYKEHGPSPIKLQAHGDPSLPLSFRNIWLRRL